MISPRELQRAMADLHTMHAGPGIAKSCLCAVLTLLPLVAAFAADEPVLFVVLAVITGIMHAAWMITTHDALHHTLTGWKWFDELVPRLISWPILWPHGIYSEVHKLHHGMNGFDLDDPERVQWTAAEYAGASALVRFYVRHQWFFDLLVFGGIGLIFKTVRHGLRLADRSGGLRRQMLADLAGIVAVNTVIYGLAFRYGMGWKWMFLWLVMERTGGFVLQWRAHVEHYGLWGKGRNFFETQLYCCRNLEVPAWVSWFFNGLNWHSVHHAFPAVPFYNLREAHMRLRQLAANDPDGQPLVEATSYTATALSFGRQPLLIGDADPASVSGRATMLPAAAGAGS